MKQFLPLLLCFSLSIFTVARAMKPAPVTRSAQKNLTAQQADAKPLVDDENTDPQIATDDEGSTAGASDNEGENVNDDGSDAPGDQDTGDTDAGDDEGADDGGGDEGK